MIKLIEILFIHLSSTFWSGIWLLFFSRINNEQNSDGEYVGPVLLAIRKISTHFFPFLFFLKEK